MNTVATNDPKSAVDSISQELARMIQQTEEAIVRMGSLRMSSFPKAVASATPSMASSTPPTMPSASTVAVDSISQRLNCLLRSMEEYELTRGIPTIPMAAATPSPSPANSTSTTTPSAWTASAPTAKPSTTTATAAPTTSSVAIATTTLRAISAPLQASPARCSTPVRSHDKRALAPLTAAPAPESTSSLVPFASLAVTGTSTAAPTASPSSILALAVLSAEEKIPTKCSTEGLSCDVDMLKVCSLEHMQRRHIMTITPVLSAGVVAFGMATDVHEDQNPVLLDPLSATSIDKGPWPPPLDGNLLTNNIQLYSKAWHSVNCGQVDVQQRPAPWPSFSYSAVSGVQSKKSLSVVLVFSG